jgi:hypothetical protein
MFGRSASPCVPPPRLELCVPGAGSEGPPTNVALPFVAQLGPRAHYNIWSPSQRARSMKGAKCSTDCRHELSAKQTCQSCTRSMRLDVTIECAEGETPGLRTDLAEKGVLLEALLHAHHLLFSPFFVMPR